MSDIFISYSSHDRPWVKVLAEALRSEGWSVWWDRTTPTGSNYYRAIENELDAARCVVVVWSKESVRSDWVPAEAQEAPAIVAHGGEPAGELGGVHVETEIVVGLVEV